MHALALSSLLRLEDIGVRHSTMVRAARVLGEASLRLSEGQYRDLSYESHMGISIDDYFSMISGKTAALFSSSLEIGAVMATDKDAHILQMRAFGHALGMTFQIHDDILSIWGDESTTGKSSASDIQMKKKTLPVIYALEKAKGADGELLRQIYQKEIIDRSDVEIVLQVLNRLNARGFAQKMSKTYFDKAISELNPLVISQEAKEELATIATFLLERQY
jgi:geranylgeranyl pyrophosphate synthase